jgi:ferric-dicitrate binding protein FerR (iron transport regulator)
MLAALLALAAADGSQGSTTAPVIGTVREIRGGVLERLDRERWSPMTVNAAVHANDRIRTGAGATAVLTLNDIGSMMVGPDTESYLGDPSRGFKSLLKRGYLWVSAKLKPGAAMSISTTSAVAGVRGTKFSVIQDAAGMSVCTCKGEVQVTLKDGRSVNVAGGMYGAIDPAGKMGEPENGKAHLAKIWKERPPRFAACLNCHRKGQKTGDLD